MNRVKGKGWLGILLTALLLCALLLPAATVLAQPPVEWDKTFSEEAEHSSKYAYSGQQTSDGGYILAGYEQNPPDYKIRSFLIKTDANGELQWEKKFPGADEDRWFNSVQQTTDGGYILAGYVSSWETEDTDGWLIKTDANGEMQWEKKFDRTCDDEISSVQQTTDGGYILAGGTYSCDTDICEAWLLKTDANGEMQWEKKFPGADEDRWFNSVQQTTDGGYILADNIWPYDTYHADALLVKTDANGELEWEKTFDSSPKNDIAWCAQQTTDGGYIFTGSTDVLGTEFYRENDWLVKTDANGELEWEKTFAGQPTLYVVGRSVRQTTDGGYIVVGTADSQYWGTADYDALLIKTDAKGNEEWHKIFDGKRPDGHSGDFGNDIQQTTDGGYIIAGHCTMPTNENAAWLIKVAATGPPMLPDLTISQISKPLSLPRGEEASFNVTLKNLSPVEVGNFTVGFYVYQDDTLISEQNQTVASLSGAGTTDVVFAWTPPAAGDYTLKAVADTRNAVEESNETNNERILVISTTRDNWEQFQKDSINSGLSSEPAPLANITKEWDYQVGSTGSAGICVAPLATDDKVFALDAFGGMWAFNAKTGEQLWKTGLSCTGMQFQLATPAYYGGKLYVATNDGHVYALNATSGLISWEKQVFSSTLSQLNTPVKYADGKVYVGSWSSATGGIREYYCLDAADGTILWERESASDGGYYWAGACIIEDYLLFGDDKGVVTCVHKDNKELVDEANLQNIEPTAGQIRSSITYNESTGRICFTEKGRCWAFNFNPETGKLTYQWHTQIGYSTSTPAVYNGRVYVGMGGFGPNGKLYCLNETNGNEIWTFTPNGGVQSSPAISIQGDKHYIYFTSNCENGTAYCLDENGQELWHFTNEQAGTSGGYTLQGVAIYDGMVYFGNDGGYLYALAQGEAPPEYTLTTTVDPANSGSVELNPAGPTYPAGTTVTLTANPAAGYTFDQWSEDLSGSTNPATITMDANKNITAHFIPRPDLSIAGITCPPDVYADEPVIVTATVYNTGAADASAFAVCLYAGDTLLETKTVDSLAAGADADVEFTWTPSATGNFTLKAVADSGNEVAEADETNNELTKEVEVLLPADLTVTGITVPEKPEKIIAGSLVPVTVILLNNGPGEAKTFTVALYAGSIKGKKAGPEEPVGTVTVELLPAGASTAIELTWTPAEAEKYLLRAVADAGDAVKETNETNNELTIEVRVKKH